MSILSRKAFVRFLVFAAAAALSVVNRLTDAGLLTESEGAKIVAAPITGKVLEIKVKVGTRTVVFML